MSLHPSDEPQPRSPVAAVLPIRLPRVELVPPTGWRRRYARRLLLGDAAVVAAVVVSAQLVWLGGARPTVTTSGALAIEPVPYAVVSFVLAATWVWALGLAGSRDRRCVGSGAEEYKGIVRASFGVFGGVAILAFLARLELARGYLLIALPFGLVMLVGVRKAWRVWLQRQRVRGRCTTPTVLAGSPESVRRLAEQLGMHASGFVVRGACLPTGAGDVVPGTLIPVVGGMARMAESLDEAGADTLILAGGGIDPAEAQALSWALDPMRHRLIIAPSIVDIAPPRVVTLPVGGTQLIHIRPPEYSRAAAATKRAFDVVVAGALVIVLAVPMLVIAQLVRRSSPGPILFSQERIGHGGEPFRMLKFRTMVVDAEARLESLRALQGDAGNAVLFKLQRDPRITAVGHALRRFSLDELPQLWNVVGGSMSLVGPRPPLPSEVARYEAHVHRRFWRKPGITGPWQVSGRSTLSWEESVRLDLSYVDNWSLMHDVLILWRTLHAVVARDGAY